MLETLFGLIPAESRGQQWLAEDLQLVNWGGYDGAHRIRFSPVATLLCGGSGSGKSTLMDAYIALMMPHTTPFNGASNGGVVGRPRGQDQRNILSYGRGKLDEARTEDGTKIRVLRGDECDTWTAISMTWIDHSGERFTAVRAWYIPASARGVEDTVRIRATTGGTFDISDLEKAAEKHLGDAAVRAAGLDTLPTDREFTARLHATLGIGAAGAGAKAMSLLARIQAGQQITTVDELYKRMVLEEPETLATADAVVEHFDGLEQTRIRMHEAQQQVRALEPIRGLRTKIGALNTDMRLLDEVGEFSDTSSRATVWRAGCRRNLLREVEDELRDRLRRAVNLVTEKQTLAQSAEDERDALSEVLRATGGERLETAQRELREVARRSTTVQAQRDRLDAALAALDLRVQTASQFSKLQQLASAALSDPDRKSATRQAYGLASAAQQAIDAKIAELEAERRIVHGRTDNIPPNLHESRAALAQAAGMSPEELPFVGELVEVRTEHEPWRAAFNLALGGFATTVLIDVAHLTQFRSAINSVRTPTRIRFEGVHTGLTAFDSFDDSTLPGRLDYRPSPFTGWLQQQLEAKFSYKCVESPKELSLHAKALTITGQISQGNQGAHGGHGRRNVLGFSNHRRLVELEEQINEARGQLVDALDALEQAESALDRYDVQRDAYRVVSELTWDSVDIVGLEAEQNRWAAVIDDVTTSNPDIARVQSQISAAKQKVADLREDIGRAKHEQEKIEARWAEITDEVDDAERILDSAEETQLSLTAEQTAYLDSQFEVPSGPENGTKEAALAQFDSALAASTHRLTSRRLAVQESLAEQRENLRRIMVSFLDRWYSPSLLADPDHSVDDFEHILSDLESSGLHTLEKEWRDSLLKMSGNDLTNLDSTLSRSLREIRDRIEPINEIMQDLPFFDDDHRLQITTRENQTAMRQRFRKELREVRSLIEAASTDDERSQVYLRMSRLIGRCRRDAPEFLDLIDVRNHVRISAERVDARTKEHVAIYDHIGEKSGGESQELIAFIVGAALRYQLGDARAPRPRYAPVFLDEALIKADAHFTARAIGAWRGLGFQLVIGAPNDKYSAIEPHVDVEYDILKDTVGRSWPKLKVGLAE